jgi:serine/threonine protein kinase
MTPYTSRCRLATAGMPHLGRDSEAMDFIPHARRGVDHDKLRNECNLAGGFSLGTCPPQPQAGGEAGPGGRLQIEKSSSSGARSHRRGTGHQTTMVMITCVLNSCAQYTSPIKKLPRSPVKTSFLIDLKKTPQISRWDKHPFLVDLVETFQTPEKLYYIYSYCEGGELFDLISMIKYTTPMQFLFFAAEIIEAISFLHWHGVRKVLSLLKLIIIEAAL